MQNVRVPGVSEKSDGPRANAVRERHLGGRTILLHNAHTRASRRLKEIGESDEKFTDEQVERVAKAARGQGVCGWCKRDVGAVLIPLASALRAEEASVVEGGGADEEGAAAPARGDAGADESGTVRELPY